MWGEKGKRREGLNATLNRCDLERPCAQKITSKTDLLKRPFFLQNLIIIIVILLLLLVVPPGLKKEKFQF